MIRMKSVTALATAFFLTTSMAPVAWGQSNHNDWGGRGIRHVLLVSIDGMHAVDYLNCSNGVSAVNNGQPYCPNLAQLGQTAVNYLDTSTSRPSDSFPGLMALMTGGTPRTFGAFMMMLTTECSLLPWLRQETAFWVGPARSTHRTAPRRNSTRESTKIKTI